MAKIYLAHHVENVTVAQRLAEVFRFLDFDVSLCSADSMGGENLDVQHFDDTDVLLVMWTPESRRDPWVVSQCRAMKDSGQMIVVMSKASASHALPLMIHESCVVWLDDAGARVSSSRLASLFAEAGMRNGRPSIGQCVFALAQRKSADRDRGLQEWVSENSADSLAATINAALQNENTNNIHASFMGLLRELTKPTNGISNIVGEVASNLPVIRIPKKVAFAGLGLFTVGALGFTLNNLVGDAPATEAVQTAQVQTEAPLIEDIKVASLQTELAAREPQLGAASVPPAPLEDETSNVYDDVSLLEDLESASFTPEDYLSSFADPELDQDYTPSVESAADQDALFPDYDTVSLNETVAIEPELPSESYLDSALEDEGLQIEASLPIEEKIEPEETKLDIPEEPAIDISEELETDVTEESELEEATETVTPQLAAYSASTQGPGDAFADRLIDGSAAPEMVIIPAGEFQMGSPLAERGRDPGEGPQKTISISRPFAVGKFEVTVAEFEKFVDATDYDAGDQCKTYRNDTWSLQDGRDFQNPGFSQTSQHPATCISWPAAIAYTDWLSEQTGETYRLLSEAEWEYVARAGSERAYPFGDDASAGCTFMNGSDESSPYGGGSSMAMSCDDGASYAARVGSYAPNRFGLHDLHGNVWEWTADAWNASISGIYGNGTARETGESFDRVVRGGSWFTFDFWLRSASRHKFAPEDRINDVGFRVARDL